MEGNASSSSSSSRPNPLYIDPSQVPELVLVSEPLTGSENYNKWSNQMLFHLAARNKLDFVLGSIPVPDPNNHKLLDCYIRCNILVTCWISNSVSKELQQRIANSGNAFITWNYLREQFQPKKWPRIFELRKRLRNLTQGNDSILVYFSKLETIWGEIIFYKPACSIPDCPLTTQDSGNENVIHFLMGLNNAFSDVRDRILLMDQIPPILVVLSLLVQEENKLKENVYVPS